MAKELIEGMGREDASASSGKYDYPFEVDYSNGRLTPTVNTQDLQDLLDATRLKKKNAPKLYEQEHFNRYNINRPLYNATEWNEAFQPSAELTKQVVEQSAIHMTALSYEGRYKGFESSVLFKPLKKMAGAVDYDPEEIMLSESTLEEIDRGLYSLTGETNPWMLAAAGFTNRGSVKQAELAQAIKEQYGRELTDDEINRYINAGLPAATISAIRQEALMGHDPEKAFGLMERIYWGSKWGRDNRRFFDPRNLGSMVVETVTDPLTFVPFGAAAKAPQFIARYIGPTLARRGLVQAAGSQALRDFGMGAAIGGGQALTYSQVRSWQGIDEDAFSMTIGAMAFGGGLSFIGGRLGSHGGGLAPEHVVRSTVKNLDDHASNIGDQLADIHIYNMAQEGLGNVDATGVNVGGLTDSQRLTLAEINSLKAALAERENLQLIYELEGLTDDIDIIKVREEIVNIRNQIDAADKAQLDSDIASRLQSLEAMDRAQSIDELRASIPKGQTGLKLASDNELSKWQQTFRKLQSKLPNLTIGGAVGMDIRPNVITHASKLMANESGWVTKNADGKMVMATRLGDNMLDVGNHINEQVYYNVVKWEDNAMKVASARGISVVQVEEEAARFLLTPLEADPRLKADMFQAITPIRQMTETLGDMYTDQTKVIGKGYTVNEAGERVATSPLLSVVTHDKSHYMPAVSDNLKVHNIVNAEYRKIQGFDSDIPEVRANAYKIAENNMIDQAAQNLYDGVRTTPKLWQKFKEAQMRDEDFQRSQHPRYVSNVDKALGKLKSKDDAIIKTSNDITEMNIALNKAKTLGRGTKTVEAKLKAAESRIERLEAERLALGAGDSRYGNTAEEQVINLIREQELREKSRGVASGYVLGPKDNGSYGPKSRIGFEDPDHTQHREAYWNYFFKGREGTASIGDMLDLRVSNVFDKYSKQSAAKLAGNELFAAKDFGEMMEIQQNWINQNFPEHARGLSSSSDKKLIEAMDGLIKSHYGMPLNSSQATAGAVDAILDIFKSFTALTKNGLFWFYNMFETAAGVHAYGANFVIKGTPFLRNKFADHIKGVTPSAADLRFMGNRILSDDLSRSRSWQAVLRSNDDKYGQGSWLSKTVSAVQFAQKNSPLSRLQMASQKAPESLVIEDMMAELVRFAHGDGKLLDKRAYGKGFFNLSDLQRAGISEERASSLINSIKSVSYLDAEGQPRIRTEALDQALIPENRYTLSVLSNYVRDEVIQRSNYSDGFLYKGGKMSGFWDLLTQFKAFGINATRKRLVKNINRGVYEGAWGETGMQFLLQSGLGVAMSQLKTLIRYNSMSDEKAKERYLQMNYGVSSYGELDWSAPDTWMRAFYNGVADSPWFAGLAMATSWAGGRQMANRTSGGNLTSKLMDRPDKTFQAWSPAKALTSNIPLLGTMDDVAGAGTTLLNWFASPASYKTVKNTRSDAHRILKTFLPNDPFVISPMLNALKGSYD